MEIGAFKPKNNITMKNSSFLGLKTQYTSKFYISSNSVKLW